MKRRQTDDHDQITEAEVKAARIKWFKGVRLFLMNLPMIYKVIALVVATVTGTIAAPEIATQVSQIAGGDATIPAGQTTAPKPNSPPDAWRADVNTSLTSQKTAIDAHTGDIAELRAEIVKLEKRLASRRAQGDNSLQGDVDENRARILELEGIVQP